MTEMIKRCRRQIRSESERNSLVVVLEHPRCLSFIKNENDALIPVPVRILNVVVVVSFVAVA